MSVATSPGRIVSMDQFRGYTVAGMFLVNFLGHLKSIHPVLQHNDNYFSYADSIMPSFIFAAGFSFRLTVLRRLPQLGAFKTYFTYFHRSLALILVSLMMYGFGRGFERMSWSEFNPDASVGSPEWWDGFQQAWGAFSVQLLKSDLWEVLAIIGVVQIFILPVIAAGFWVRLLAMIGCGVGHAWLTHWFNWEFLFGYQGNSMVDYWQVAGNRSWDGGIFGIVSWSVPMLAGTLAYDIYTGCIGSGGRPANAANRLLVWGLVFMALGYGMSCLTRLYDVEYGAVASEAKKEHAASPVMPPFENARGRPFLTLLAEPPFVPPPSTDVRLENYWLMGKRVVTLSFITFSTGFALAAYALFVFACDVGSLRVGVFRTFGTNPLAAYVIHYMWYTQILTLVPHDAPVWFCVLTLTVFFVLTYLFVRHLEKHNVYIRL